MDRNGGKLKTGKNAPETPHTKTHSAEVLGGESLHRPAAIVPHSVKGGTGGGGFKYAYIYMILPTVHPLHVFSPQRSHNHYMHQISVAVHGWGLGPTLKWHRTFVPTQFPVPR